MSKGFKNILFFMLFLLSWFSFFPRIALAENQDAACTFTYDPNPQTTDMKTLKVTVQSKVSAFNSDQYTLWWYPLKDGKYQLANSTTGTKNKNAEGGVGSIDFTLKEPEKYSWYHWSELGDKQVKLEMEDKSGDVICKAAFTVIKQVQQSDCLTVIKPKPLSPQDSVLLTITGLIKDQEYNVYVNSKKEGKIKPDTEKNLGRYDVGKYLVEIEKDNKLQCPRAAFEVAPTGSGKGGQIDPEGLWEGCKPGDSDCTTSGDKETTLCDNETGIRTAIGCIHTNPVALVKDFLKFALGISGGIAFLLMLLGAFQMLTSAGNPETLAAGKSRLTSAIIGLLFVIFSVLLLKIIGVDILGLEKQFGYP